MSIEKRLERIEAILDARGLDWDHPRVSSDHFAGASKMVAEEPPKKWRRLTDEFVQPGDWMNAKVNRQDVDPPDGGWIPADPCYFGRRACTLSMYFARPVADEPAKEAPEPITLDEFLRSIKPPEPAKPRESGPEVKATNHFADANKMVAEEPAKEPVDHLAVPRMSPGEWVYIHEAYRDVTPADVGKLVIVRNDAKTPWIELRLAEVTGADFPYRCTKDGLDPTMWQAFRYARIWNERPANKAQPAWEPNVGDWVRVTRPENWKEWKDPLWREEMHIYDGKVFEFVKWSQWSTGQRAILQGIDWFFHRDWLSPAESPAKDKPAEPEYREPVLPADVGKECEFSIDGKAWTEAKLRGYAGHLWQSVSSEVVGAQHWVHARIKEDA